VPRVQDLVQLAFTPNQAKHICDSNGGWYQPFYAVDGNYSDDTWVYASSITVTVPTSALTRYEKGMKVRLKQGGGYKYYYITIVTATVITLNGGSDYTVANAAITDLEVSSAESPFGFPDFFNWTTTLSGGGAPAMIISAPVISFSKFSIKGKTVLIYVMFTCTTADTANSDLRFTLPTTNTTNNAGGACRIGNTSGGLFGSWLLSNGLCIVRISGDGNWGLGTLRTVVLTGFYEF